MERHSNSKSPSRLLPAQNNHRRPSNFLQHSKSASVLNCAMDYFPSTHTYTPPAYVRILAASSSDNSTTDQDEGSDDSNNGRDAFEFVAFLLWYLFLVLCCVLPTCCAYRRRRLMETRIAEQQESFDQLHQQNVLILRHLRPDLDGEEARIERTQRITEALKVTTFVSTSTQRDQSRCLILHPRCVFRCPFSSFELLHSCAFFYCCTCTCTFAFLC